MNDPFAADDLDIYIAKPTPFPGIMLATGILWILAGGAYCALFGLLRLLRVEFHASELWLVLGAAFFIKDGVQLIRGQFRDPLVDGILTILIGTFFLGRGIFDITQGNPFGLIFGGFFGLVFLIPGILVLAGRKQYLKWRDEQGL